MSYDNPVKRRVRSMLRKFVKKTILRHHSPKEVRVLCLPGPEAIEIFQIWDRLGVPRENVVAFERDPGAYRALVEKDLGITVFNLDVNHFLVSNVVLRHGPFHVVNLDYTGHLTWEVQLAIHALFSGRMLAPRSVLATTFMRAREQEAVKSRYISTIYGTGWLAHFLAEDIKRCLREGVHDERDAAEHALFLAGLDHIIRVANAILRAAWESKALDLLRMAIPCYIVDEALGLAGLKDSVTFFVGREQGCVSLRFGEEHPCSRCPFSRAGRCLNPLTWFSQERCEDVRVYETIKQLGVGDGAVVLFREWLRALPPVYVPERVLNVFYLSPRGNVPMLTSMFYFLFTSEAERRYGPRLRELLFRLAFYDLNANNIWLERVRVPKPKRKLRQEVLELIRKGKLKPLEV